MQKGPRITKKNAFEARVAYKLGGKLTKASGAVHNNGDIYLDTRFLIEDKGRSASPIYIEWDVFEKIQEQAHKRSRIPILVVSDITTGYDFAVIESKHLLDLSAGNMLSCYYTLPSKRIRVSTEEFLEKWTENATILNVGLGFKYILYGEMVCPGRPVLAIMKLEDFRDIIKN